MQLDRKQLAELVIETLDKQQDYFRSRSTDLLRECKSLERRLREAAENILNPESAGLFHEETE